MLCWVDDDCLFASAASLILDWERWEGRGGNELFESYDVGAFFDSHFLCVVGQVMSLSS